MTRKKIRHGCRLVEKGLPGDLQREMRRAGGPSDLTSRRWVMECANPDRPAAKRAIAGSINIQRLMDFEKRDLADYHGVEGDLWRIEYINTRAPYRRTGVATKLYERAAGFVCKMGGRLISDDRLPDAHSHDFWEKQARKGRVTEVYDASMADPTYVLSCRHRRDLSGLKRKRKRRR